MSDVATLLGLRPVTIYRWCRSGRLSCVKIGKEWRIARSALDDLLPHDLRQRLADRIDEGGRMRDISPATRDSAQRFLRHEAGGRLEAEALAAAAERAFGWLRTRLTGLLGMEGFTALFRRALRLARNEFPILIGLAVNETADEILLGFREFGAANAGDPAAVADALSAILAQLIWLLVTFVGEELTIRLVGEMWPELAHDAEAPSAQVWRHDA